MQSFAFRFALGSRDILLARTPSAAGPRSLLIASGLQILGIVASGSSYFWGANMLFGMIGGFTLESWGTLRRFWETGEHNKGNFKVQAWMFTEFWWILVPMGVIWHAWCRYFGVLEDPGTILGRSLDTGGNKEGPCEVQAWILLIFC